MVEELFDGRPESLRRFFATWYGPPDRVGWVPDRAKRLPTPLRAWYGAAPSYSAAVTFHNTVLDPDEVDYVDGNSCSGWRTRRPTSGPPTPIRTICGCTSGPLSATSPGTPPVALSDFLVSVAVFEVVLGANHFRHAEVLTVAEHDVLLAPLRTLPMPGPPTAPSYTPATGLVRRAPRQRRATPDAIDHVVGLPRRHGRRPATHRLHVSANPLTRSTRHPHRTLLPRGSRGLVQDSSADANLTVGIRCPAVHVTVTIGAVTKGAQLARVEADLAHGHTHPALQRLANLTALFPDDLDIRATRAKVNRQIGNMAEAGRWGFLA